MSGGVEDVLPIARYSERETDATVAKSNGLPSIDIDPNLSEQERVEAMLKNLMRIATERTTDVIERCFVEVRRRTRLMVVFTNAESVDRIIYAIFSRFNEDWKNHTLELFTQAA